MVPALPAFLFSSAIGTFSRPVPRLTSCPLKNTLLFFAEWRYDGHAV